MMQQHADSPRMLAHMQYILHQSPSDWAGDSLKPRIAAWQQLAPPCKWCPFHGGWHLCSTSSDTCLGSAQHCVPR